MSVYEYSRWDGSQRLDPFDAGALLDAMADELLAGRDPRRLLQRIQRDGLPRQGLEGLRGLLDRLKTRRQQALQRFNIGSTLEEIKKDSRPSSTWSAAAWSAASSRARRRRASTPNWPSDSTR